MKLLSNGKVVTLETLEFDLADVARVMSQINRFNGHTDRPYSVAQHSTLVSLVCAERELKLHALLHDVHEYWLGDIITPVADELAGLDTLKWAVDSRLAVLLDIPSLIDPEARAIVKHYDEQVTLAEAHALLPNAHLLFDPPQPNIIVKPVSNIKKAFKKRFSFLTEKGWHKEWH